MKNQTPSEKLKEVTMQLTFLEGQNRAAPDRKLNKIITQLRAVKGTLESIIE
jgi:DNA-binding FrmR family transcriptional regulator